MRSKAKHPIWPEHVDHPTPVSGWLNRICDAKRYL
jgi:hypothetical protein